MGSGEGALSGDSYYGDGVYKSTDGGVTWTHVSSLFTGQATSALAVDPTNPNHVYAATLRGRGGNHRTTAPTEPAYGVWESTDGGRELDPAQGHHDELHGATDLVMDPQNPKNLWASFWGDGIYKSTDGGDTWTSVAGQPAGRQLPRGRHPVLARALATRRARPTPTVYTGFDYFDLTDVYHAAPDLQERSTAARRGPTPPGTARPAPTLSSATAARSASTTTSSSPTRPTPTSSTRSASTATTTARSPAASTGPSTAAQTWQNLGYDLHPDFHAIAFQPNDTQHIAIGNDGGVWQSHTGGGRNGPGAPLARRTGRTSTAPSNPTTAALVHSTGLAITQFTSIATVPKVPGQYWGGTQDNGTLRKSLVEQPLVRPGAAVTAVR